MSTTLDKVMSIIGYAACALGIIRLLFLLLRGKKREASSSIRGTNPSMPLEECLRKLHALMQAGEEPKSGCGDWRNRLYTAVSLGTLMGGDILFRLSFVDGHLYEDHQSNEEILRISTPRCNDHGEWQVRIRNGKIVEVCDCMGPIDIQLLTPSQAVCIFRIRRHLLAEDGDAQRTEEGADEDDGDQVEKTH